MNKDIPDDLIIKNLAGESTPEEERMLWQWVDKGDENKKIFFDAIKIYSGKDDMISKDEVEKRLLMMNLYRDRSLPASWELAASLLLICVFAAAIVLLGHKNVVEEASFGVTKRITLPDQSLVWLNGGTKLTYIKHNFRQRRKVLLEGEAYFQVVGGTSPFVIAYDSIEANLDSGEVNVQTNPHELEKVAIVSKGSVMFSDLRKEMEITASTDHEVISRSDYGLIARSINKNLNYKSWLTGIYVFDDEPIERVFSILSSGNADFEVDDIECDRLITGIFKINKSCNTKSEIMRLIDSEAAKWK